MDENLHDIDDLFKKGINDYEDIPSPDVWNNLDNSLDKKKVVSISKKYNKLKWVAAALLIFSAGMAMYTWHTKLRNRELVRENKMVNRTTASAKFPQHPASSNKTARDTAMENNSSKHLAIDLNKKTLTAGETAQKSTNDFLREPTRAVVQSANPLLANSRTTEINAEQKNQSLNSQSHIDTLPNTADQNHRYQVDIATVTSTPPAFQSNTSNSLQNHLVKVGVANTITNALEKTSKKSLKRKFGLSATVFYSPDFTFSRVDNDRHNFREDDKNEIKNKETRKTSASAGVLINFETGKKWSISAGLTYAALTTAIQPKTIFARPDNRGNISFRYNCSAGYSYVNVKTANTPATGDSVTALASSSKLEYLGLPVMVNYNMKSGKLSLVPSLGFSVNILTKANIHTAVPLSVGNGSYQVSDATIEGLNSNYITGLLSFGINYRLNKKLSISLSPTERFAITAINKETPVKTYLNTFGIAGGLTLHL